MLDFDFIEFYVKKKYGKNLQEYFSVNGPTISKWRNSKMPEKRIHEFVFKEESSSPKILITKIY